MPPLDPVTAGAVHAASKGAEFMAGKDMTYWFLVTLILGAIGALIALRWLLQQYTEQRNANTALNKEFLNYIAGDHIKSIEAQNKMSDSLNRLAGVIEDMEKRKQ